MKIKKEYINIIKKDVERFRKLKYEYIDYKKIEKTEEEFKSILKNRNFNFSEMLLLGGGLYYESIMYSAVSSKKGVGSIYKKLLKKELEEFREKTNIIKEYMGILMINNNMKKENIFVDNKRSKRISMALKRRFDVLKKYNFKCKYCGRSAPEVSLELEHIIPRCLGGDDSIENLSPACKDCNLGKGGVALSAINNLHTKQRSPN